VRDVVNAAGQVINHVDYDSLGRILGYRTAESNHWFYVFRNRIIDPTGAQYITTAAQRLAINRSGLRWALWSGIFTKAQYNRFWRIARGIRLDPTEFLAQIR
jgi:hypothetical protein